MCSPYKDIHTDESTKKLHSTNYKTSLNNTMCILIYMIVQGWKWKSALGQLRAYFKIYTELTSSKSVWLFDFHIGAKLHVSAFVLLATVTTSQLVEYCPIEWDIFEWISTVKTVCIYLMGNLLFGCTKFIIYPYILLRRKYRRYET